MAVREFDGTGELLTSIGALSAMTYGTMAFLVKPASTGGASNGVSFLSDGTDFLVVLYFEESGSDWFFGWFNFDDSSGDDSNFASFSNEWWLIVWRKGTGNVTARISAYNLDTDTWAHDDLDLEGGAVSDWAAPGSGGFTAHEGYEGRIAAWAAWSNSLPWAANSTGDSAIEAAGLETAAANWLANSPDAMWLFNQDAVTTDVEDVTGNGADQLSRTGTSVVTGDDPPGFDFALDEVVTADISHGLALGHSLTADVTSTAEITHGIALGHAMTVDLAQEITANISHGIALGHAMDVAVKTDVSTAISHGIALSHRADVAIGTPPQTELVQLEHRILTDSGLVGATV